MDPPTSSNLRKCRCARGSAAVKYVLRGREDKWLRLAGKPIGWQADWLAGRLAGRPIGWQVDWLAGRLAGRWQADWLAGRLAGRSIGWQAGSAPQKALIILDLFKGGWISLEFKEKVACEAITQWLHCPTVNESGLPRACVHCLSLTRGLLAAKLLQIKKS